MEALIELQPVSDVSPEVSGFLDRTRAASPGPAQGNEVIAEAAPPRVLIAILAKQKERSLPLYLACIDALDYPKKSIVLHVRTNNNTDRTTKMLEEWLARVGHQYAGVEFDASDVAEPVQQFGVHEWNTVRFKVLARIRQDSMAAALRNGCDFYFVADVDNFIKPNTLKDLVAANLPIVSPLLQYHDQKRLYSNYHEKVDQNGYFINSEEYYWLLYQKVKGLCQVAVVHCTYLVRCDVIPQLTYDDGSGRYEYVIFSDSARRNNIPQYLDNRQIYGYLTLDEDTSGAVRLLSETVSIGARKADIAAAKAKTKTSRPGPTPTDDSLIFLHSSWRTASTWLWAKFRQSPAAIAYYEPFHEFLDRVKRSEATTLTPNTWQSRHPNIDPYFLEYLPLLRRAGGARLFSGVMSYDWFIPQGGLRGELRPAEKRYLALLVRDAWRRGRMPVLGCTRSLARSAAIKQAFGGFHVFLHRNLWKQWVSYLDCRQRGDRFFFITTPILVNRADDPFLAYLAEFYMRRSLELSGRDGSTATALIGTDKGFEVLAALPNDLAFAMFMALHTYLYAHGQGVADLIVDVSHMAHDADYRVSIEEAIARRTGFSISLADVRDELCAYAASIDTAAINWALIREQARLAVQMLGSGDQSLLMANADRFIDAAFAEATGNYGPTATDLRAAGD